MNNNHLYYSVPCVTVRPPRPAGSAPEPPARPSLASPLDVRHATTESTVAPVILPRDRIPRWKRRYYRPAPAHPSSTKRKTQRVRAEVHAPESGNPVKTPAQDEGHNKLLGAGSDKPVKVTVKNPAHDEGHDKL